MGYSGAPAMLRLPCGPDSLEHHQHHSRSPAHHGVWAVPRNGIDGCGLCNHHRAGAAACCTSSIICSAVRPDPAFRQSIRSGYENDPAPPGYFFGCDVPVPDRQLQLDIPGKTGSRIRGRSHFGPYYAIRICIFTIPPAWGIANAAATLNGAKPGAGFPDRAEKSVWRSAFLAFVFALVAVVFFFWAKPSCVSSRPMKWLSGRS